MEVLYDTFQIQPPINSEVLMDVETKQKMAYSPQTLRTAPNQTLVRRKSSSERKMVKQTTTKS